MNRKQISILILDLGLIVLGVFSIGFTYKTVENATTKIVIMSILVLLLLLLVNKEIYSLFVHNKSKSKTTMPCVIALVNEEEEVVKVWELNKQIGLMIGKSTENTEADIDLSDVEFAGYIDHEHATFNYTSTGWWIEDVGSTNGTVFWRNGKEFLLSPGAPNKILPGDVIFLGEYTKLVVS